LEKNTDCAETEISEEKIKKAHASLDVIEKYLKEVEQTIAENKIPEKDDMNFVGFMVASAIFAIEARHLNNVPEIKNRLVDLAGRATKCLEFVKLQNKS
jgi:hypothetical protein